MSMCSLSRGYLHTFTYIYVIIRFAATSLNSMSIFYVLLYIVDIKKHQFYRYNSMLWVSMADVCLHYPTNCLVLTDKYSKYVFTMSFIFSLQPPPATPNMISSDYKSVQHRFPIQHGHTKESSNEYTAFRQHYCLTWGPIVSTLKRLEKVLQEYAVPIAFVNGDKLADLALEYELEIQPSTLELFSTLVNLEDVEALVKTPVSLLAMTYIYSVVYIMISGSSVSWLLYGHVLQQRCYCEYSLQLVLTLVSCLLIFLRI